jgi:hypothetical protein
MPVLGDHPLRLDDPLDRTGRVADGAILPCWRRASFVSATARTLCAASLPATCNLHVPVGGVSESPLAAMHCGDALAILGIRRECERANVEAGRDR